ncbi:hypothetical protein ACTFIY_001361 [Dictyostelium cf. discoideum]
MVSENVIDLVLIIMFNINGYFKNDTLAKHKISIIKIINLNHLEANHLIVPFTIQEQNKSNNNCGFFTVFNILSTIKFLINVNNKIPLISQNKINIDSIMYDFNVEDFRSILNNTLKEFYNSKDLNLNNLLYCFNNQKKAKLILFIKI